MIIWSLFDSETACVASTFAEEHEMYSFGIGNGTKHVHLDLSDFAEAKKVLDTYPKPEAIFASPPCESWVRVNIGSIRFFDIRTPVLNLHWRRKWVGLDKTAKLKAGRINGCKTAKTTASIIRHYQPKFWAIENGSSSLIFDYMKDKKNLLGYKNKTRYCNYEFNVEKPTIIYSNKKLNLRNEKPKTQMDLITSNASCSRTLLRAQGRKVNKRYDPENVKVPPLLYRHIMSEWMLGGQPVLLPLWEVV